MEKRTTRRVTWRKEVFDSEQVPDDVNLQTIIHAKNKSELKKELKKYKYRSETPIVSTYFIHVYCHVCLSTVKTAIWKKTYKHSF